MGDLVKRRQEVEDGNICLGPHRITLSEKVLHHDEQLSLARVFCTKTVVQWCQGLVAVEMGTDVRAQDMF